MSPARQKTVNHQEVDKAIRDRVAGADEARQDRLRALERVRETSDRMQQREHERLRAKHGANDPRVAEAETRMQAGLVTLRTIRREIQRAAIAPPPVDDAAWIVFGLVLDAGGSPLRGVTVAVVDEHGEVVAPNKPRPTEKDGAFQISVAVAPRDKGERGRVAAAKPAEGPKQTPPMVHLEVFRNETRRMAADPVTFLPAAGSVDYREIVVWSAKGTEKRPPK